MPEPTINLDQPAIDIANKNTTILRAAMAGAIARASQAAEDYELAWQKAYALAVKEFQNA